MKAPSFLFTLFLVVLGFLLMPGLSFAAEAAAMPAATTGDPVFDLVLHIIPPGYRGLALLLVWAFPYLTRGYWAIVNNGGLVNGLKAILFGLNSKAKVLLLLLGCCLLTACGALPNGEKTFLGLTSSGWGEVAKETGKDLPAQVWKNYGKVKSEKQPVELLLPPVEATGQDPAAASWWSGLTGWFK